MKPFEELRIESRIPVAEAERRLNQAFQFPSLPERVVPMRSRLIGDVRLPDVRARRYRGGNNYLEFEGRLSESDGKAVLNGRLVPPEYSAPSMLVGFVVFFAGLLATVAVWLWQWPETVGLLVIAGFVAATVPALRKFKRMNVEAEAMLLRKDLEVALRGPDV